jgi:hypothetical protein
MQIIDDSDRCFQIMIAINCCLDRIDKLDRLGSIDNTAMNGICLIRSLIDKLKPIDCFIDRDANARSLN